ncbi:MAG: SulP family inorganic anion transporter, partial [Elusimicrobiota bacterium]
MAQEHRLTGEAWGGLAASLVALPQSIAFGVAIYAALGPAYAAYGALAGFLGAAAIGLTTASFGGAPRLISSPCAPAAALMAPLVADLLTRTGSPERVMVLMVFTGLLVGILQMAYGLLGGGRLIKYIPYPVVTGYMSGVAILILLGQGPRLFGLPKGLGLAAGLIQPGLWRWPALFVGAATMLAMVLGPRWTKKVPATLLGVGAGVLAYLWLGAFEHKLYDLTANPLVVGPIGGQGAGFGAWTGRWAAVMNGGWADLKLLFFPALTLSVLLSIDTLKTGVVLDALTQSRHSSNRELFGQGLGNLVSGLAGGVPGSATMAGTLVNLSSGGSGRASGV